MPKKRKPQTEVLRFRVDQKLQSDVKRISEELDRSASWIVRKAVEEFIERHKSAKVGR